MSAGDQPQLTVAEMIRRLQLFPSDALVWIGSPYEGCRWPEHPAVNVEMRGTLNQKPGEPEFLLCVVKD